MHIVILKMYIMKNEVSRNIKFSEYAFDYISEYKEAHGVSLQAFVEEAVLEKIQRIEDDLIQKNLKYLNK